VDIGVFIPIGNNGWLISTTSPQYKPSLADSSYPRAG
jgi:pyrimidine oxygenase